MSSSNVQNQSNSNNAPPVAPSQEQKDMDLLSGKGDKSAVLMAVLGSIVGKENELRHQNAEMKAEAAAVSTVAAQAQGQAAMDGAKAEAMTILDMLLKPEVLVKAKEYYKNEQTKEIQYTPLVGEKDNPAIFLNQKIMTEFAPKLKPTYYDPTKYKTYLEQLGIQYPTLRPDQKEAVSKLKK